MRISDLMPAVHQFYQPMTKWPAIKHQGGGEVCDCDEVVVEGFWRIIMSTGVSFEFQGVPMPTGSPLKNPIKAALNGGKDKTHKRTGVQHAGGN